MHLLQELLQLNEVKMNEDGIYKHPSGMCEVHVDDSDPEDGVQARVVYKHVEYDDEEQLEICHDKYLPFVRQVMNLYDLDIEDAQTHDAEDDDGNTFIPLQFPPQDLD